MKNITLPVILLVVTALIAVSCVNRRVYVSKGKMPPGHAKKYFGTKSAKPFAPGQRNKRVRTARF